MDDPETQVRAALNALIEAGTSGDLTALDQIYHRDMTIFMLNEGEELVQSDKPNFIAMLSEMVKTNGAPMSTWAHIHSVTLSGSTAHVLIDRRVEMGGALRSLTLSIDFVHEDGRWQVMREVILNRPFDAAQAA